MGIEKGQFHVRKYIGFKIFANLKMDLHGEMSHILTNSVYIKKSSLKDLITSCRKSLEFKLPNDYKKFIYNLGQLSIQSCK